MSLTVHTAALNKQLNVLRSLLSEDRALVNSLDVDERTPMHWAASSGALDIVRFLIDQGAEVDLPDGAGWTPLLIAVSAGHTEVVQELIGAGANVNRQVLRTTSNDDPNADGSLLDRTNDKGITPLHYAASKSRIDIGRLLISRGADYNARDKANQLPLHRAATTGSVGFIRLLIESSTPSKKLRLNTADRNGNTPLHLAMDSAHAAAAVALIEAGADRTRENLDSETPEQVPGVGGQEQKLARQYIVDHCGKA